MPTGFCATIFAEGIGHTRHIVVSSDGVVYANTWSGEYFGNDKTHEGGFLVALQDKSGAGKADTIERFGGTEQTGDHGGTGIGIYNGSIYAETNDSIVKYALTSGSIAPTGSAVTVVSGLPLGGDHPMHPFIITSDGSLLVDVASATNSCQAKNRTLKSPGDNPCKELETRGGIWRYDANKTDQKFSPSDRYATGIRNGEGFAIDANGQVFVTQHGRDQLHTNWPEIFKAPDLEATLPAEEVLALNKGGDYGWPYCFYDNFQQKLILAPEYGGDSKKVGMCADKTGPAAAFPAHWGPNGMTRYDKDKFPARYREGLFIAFHGSWNRAPYPQGGYNIVFQPMSGTKASATMRNFCRRFRRRDQNAGESGSPARRPRGRTRRRALHFRRHQGPHLSRDVERRLCRRHRRSDGMPEPHRRRRLARKSQRESARRNESRRRRARAEGRDVRDGRSRRQALSCQRVHRLPRRQRPGHDDRSSARTQRNGSGATEAGQESQRRSPKAWRNRRNIAARCPRWAARS